MYHVKETHFKMHLIYIEGVLHAMGLNNYYNTHLKSLQYNIL